jgi:hypothetical protein
MRTDTGLICQYCTRKFNRTQSFSTHIWSENRRRANIATKKTCTKCGLIKDLQEFDKNSTMTYGRMNSCKQCKSKYNKEYSLKNPEKIRARNSRIRKKTPEQLKAHGRFVRAYWKKFPERKKANDAVNHAIRYGKLKRQPCEVCGNPKSQSHHDDYSKPLEVRWLCPIHHKVADKERKLREVAA